MELLAALAPYVPLGQTVLWLLLVVGMVAWFRKHVHAVLASLQRRIESGSTVKAGWFELSNQFHPQTPEVQRQRAETEAREVLEQQTTSVSGGSPPSLGATVNSVLQVEDLALRAIQSEYGVTLSRQVATDVGSRFDAAFFKDGQLYVVEVKVFFGSVSPMKLRTAAAGLVSSTEHLRTFKTRLLLVLVFKRDEDVQANSERVRDALHTVAAQVELRQYSLPELRRQFGAPSSES